MSEEAIAATGEVVEEEEEKESWKTMETLTGSGLCRKEKRKMAKKLKRKQMRKEMALKQQAEEEARSKDPEEQLKLRLKEQEEVEFMERQRREFEEREKLWIERATKIAEEEAQRKLLEEELQRNQVENEDEINEDDSWEYVEEGPAEIIWQGNEIIVKKKRVRVPKGNAGQQPGNEDADRPTSNPLPPQSEAFSSYKNTPPVSAQQVFESVAQQTPNFGTEQDKAHCPFHIKTGACRFGSRCSRVHLYPDKSCTLLIKNMYNGPGLALEQDEGLEIRNSSQDSFRWRFKDLALFGDGDKSFIALLLLAIVCMLGDGRVLLCAITPKGLNLKHTDEEIEHCYEEFYEDVHTEFLKFGEIVNFKVCKNGSFHLRGNVYVHYKALNSAVLAYNSINGRYFAGKQITCEFVGVTRWKVAICGEYMKLRFKTCSRGTACNFIHCFRNPGGDYEWADCDNPPPKYWLRKMAALFGPSDESGYDQHMEQESRGQLRNSRKKIMANDGYHSRRYRSRDVDFLDSSFGGEYSDENRSQWSSHSSRQIHSSSRKKRSSLDEQGQSEDISELENDRYDGKNLSSDRGYGDRDGNKRNSRSRTRSRHHKKGEDIPDNQKNLKDQYSSDECERYERKDRLHSHDSNRKHSGCHQFQSQIQSSRRESLSRQIKDAGFLDEQMKSDKNYVSDSPRWYDGRHKPHDPYAESNYSEKIDVCDRWETGTSFLDGNERSGTSYNFDDQEQYDGRYSSHDQSSARHSKEIRLRCNQINRMSYSNSRGERDSSCEESVSSGKRELQKSHDHNKLPNGGVGDSFSSGEPKVKLDSEHDESGEKGVNSKSTRKSKKHGSSSKRRSQCVKRKNEDTEEDESSIQVDNNLELKMVSGKRSRSRTPVECLHRSKRERHSCGHES